MTRKTFTFRSSWYEAMGKMSDTQRLSLMDAICRYAIDGELTQAMDPVVEIAFILIRAEIDAAPNRSRKKDPKPESGLQPEATPESEPQSELPEAPQKPQPTTITETARDFDEIFYDMSFEVASDCVWRDLILDRIPVADCELLMEEFRDYIIERGRTGEFTDGSLSEHSFCQKLLDSLDDGFIPSDMALDRME